MYKNRRGFTLAEILVTLGIIGVIASMTIPNLVQDVQDAQFKIALKKQFGVLSQAYKLMLTQNSSNLSGISTDSTSFKDKILPYLNYIKSCNTGSTAGNCWHAERSVKNLNGTYVPIWGDGSGIILADGTIMRLALYNFSNCRNTQDIFCGDITIDVNGFSAPNKLGKDIFRFFTYEFRIGPYGNIDDCIPSDNGHTCSGKYLKE